MRQTPKIPEINVSREVREWIFAHPGKFTLDEILAGLAALGISRRQITLRIHQMVRGGELDRHGEGAWKMAPAFRPPHEVAMRSRTLDDAAQRELERHAAAMHLWQAMGLPMAVA